MFQIPKGLITTTMQQGDASVQAIAQEVLENLSRAEERVERASNRKQGNPGTPPTSNAAAQQHDGPVVMSALPHHRTSWKLP